MAIEDISYHLMNLKIRLEVLAQRYLGAELCSEAKKFSEKYPFVLGTFFLTLIFSAIPIFIFVCFAVISAVIALICFICIEGCLLIVGGLILAGVVSFITILTAGVTVSFSIAFWFAQRFHRLFCSHTRALVPRARDEGRQDADSSDT